MLHVNFTSGIPVDGPSAGIAIFSVLYSALFNRAIPGDLAMTGEISIKGQVCPVGGVYEKILAAKEAGVKKVIIPKANMQQIFSKIDINIVPVETIEEVIEEVFKQDVIKEANQAIHA